jgi:hypothetical protein
MKFAMSCGFVALVGCASTSTTTSDLIVYHPKEGDRQTINVVLVSSADRGPTPRFQPGFQFRYDPKLGGSMARVVVEVSVDNTGTVTNAKPVFAEPEFIGPPIAASFMRARFRLAQSGGASIPCTIRVTETFSL